MTNHVHLLLTPTTPEGVSLMMQALGREYVRYFNFSYKRTGTLWEGRFKSCVVDADNYLLTCQKYIEMNPVRAGMVADPSEYFWSSYQANGHGMAIDLCTPHSVYLALGSTKHERLMAYRELFRFDIEDDDLETIRHATNKGMAVGNDRFKAEIKALTGRRVVALKRGPKPR
jgi:putative transposase